MFIAGSECFGSEQQFRAVDPQRNVELDPAFGGATKADVVQACRMADEAFESYRQTTPDERARFLENIAERIDALGAALTERAAQETGLSASRLDSERNRTSAQLRLFASVVRAGNWMDIHVSTAQPDRQPQPRADLRRQCIPLGPVAVFGASNFPLAFSVAGGDTASALAAGAPVVVKAHPAHPGTSELVARAIVQAAQHCQIHPGVFSLVFGPGHAIGTALVANPYIKAVGFTGSRSGGRALMEVAARRPVPIPVYAEMSSINPVILLPAALRARADTLAADFVASLTASAGQLCTNPGLLIAIDSPELTQFVDGVQRELKASVSLTMLTSGIHAEYERGGQRLQSHTSVELAGHGTLQKSATQGCGRLFVTSADAFIADSTLSDEVFGATSLLVRCHSAEQLLDVIASLEGQLTASVMFDDEDRQLAGSLLTALETRVGRISGNAFPTGVEVCHAMVHGGPFPATSDGKTTSVGSAAIERFLRPVCYQGIPDALLPPALKNNNPLQMPRFVDGQSGNTPEQP